jgi:hypothetical protein
LSARQTLIFPAALVLALGIAAPAGAQTPAPASVSTSGGHSLSLTGSFGYLFTRVTGDGGDTIPNGWIATAEGLFDGRYAAVLEFAGNYPSDEHTYRSVLAGGKLILKKTGPVTPFVQLLAGKGRSSAVGDGVSAFTLQPGAGVDWAAAPHIGIRFQGDYDWRSRPDGNVNGYRFAASIFIR